jgi:hypothetical protein
LPKKSLTLDFDWQMMSANTMKWPYDCFHLYYFQFTIFEQLLISSDTITSALDTLLLNNLWINIHFLSKRVIHFATHLK